MAINKYPLWKNLLVIITVMFGILYSLPNLFGEDYALQISSKGGKEISKASLTDKTKEITDLLTSKNIQYKSVNQETNGFLIRLKDSGDQLNARMLITSNIKDFNEEYVIALNLAPATPAWLTALGAEPMKLGLDLRGGVHFLMEVDVESAISRYIESDLEEVRKQLREEKIRYSGVTTIKDAQNPDAKNLVIKFRNIDDLNKAKPFLQRQFGHLDFSDASPKDTSSSFVLLAKYSMQEKTRIRNYAMEQNISTLRKRVNELGVAEAIVQRQGTNRIVVELPGIQDTARAKDIIGKTATVEFRLAYPGMTDNQSTAPVGYTLLPMHDGTNTKHPVKQEVIITGESIIGAYSEVDQQTGGPAVAITLGGNSGPIRKFSQVTLENIGKPMATVYVETNVKEETQPDGSVKNIKEVNKNIISIATINSALGKRFQITGLKSIQEAKNLALLLRSGALAAPVHIVSERTIGPSLGKENISMGLNSVMYGMLLVLLFMALYYRTFGMIANIALFMNLVLLVAVCSLIHVTMTLPGIAGIVLTLGMAVDANVLIFERIREELRLGNSIQTSIKAGYEKAFATIIDANVTTLIAAVVLFSIGSGAVKGFAITLSIGLLTSMFTAVTGSRAIVNFLYGDKRLNSLPIGM